MAASDRAVCRRCETPRSFADPTGLCLPETGQDKPQHKSSALRLLAIAAAGIGAAAYFGYDAARRREAIVSKVGDSAAHFERPVALHEQGKLADAIEEYRASLRIIPGSAEARYNLGVALNSQGNVDAAFAEFRQSRDIAGRGSELALQTERVLVATRR
jgi:tetratricopeptide (TPR) repeat protein